MISMIWCEDIQHGIGYNNKLPWSIKEEMNHFKQTTMGKIVVCGEKTFFSFGGKPLSGRTNVIITLDKSLDNLNNVLVYHDVNKLINDFKKEDIFIIGGKTIYNLFFPYADKLIISTLKKKYKCNVFMNFDLSSFEKTKSEDYIQFVVNYYNRIKKY